MFTIITGNEVVADFHIGQNLDQPYKPVTTQCFLGGTHVFNAFALASGIRDENLDGRVVVLGPVSNDRFGRDFRAIAKTLGVDTSHTRETDNSTLIAIVERSAHNNSFHFPNKSDSALSITQPDDLTDLPDQGGKIVIVQGLASSITSSSKQAWEEYVDRNADMMVVYDANIRLPAIDDIEEHKKILTGWAGRSHVMKVSDADIELIYGADADPEAVIKSYLDAGTKVVCMTTGSKPVQTYTAHGKIESPLETLRVANTVGAGDNFVAGITLGFAKGAFFNAANFDAATPDKLRAVVQSGIDQSARHLRLINQ